MSASPRQLENDLDTTTVSWDSSLTKKGSFIGIYTPPTASDGEFMALASIDATVHAQLASTEATAQSLTVSLSHLRADGGYQMRLFDGSADCNKDPGAGFDCPLVAVSPNVTFVGGADMPTQVHLSLGAGNAVVVTWVSGASGVPTVDVQAAGGGRAMRFNGTSVTYTHTDMCNAPANESYPWWYPTGVNAGHMHRVVLQGLASNTRYTYALGMDGVLHAQGGGHAFVSPPSGADAGVDTPVTFLALGDIDHAKAWCDSCVPPASHTHPGAGAEANFDALAAEAAHAAAGPAVDAARFVLAVGDLSYARGSAWRWDVWGAQIASFASSLPSLVSLGNHEADHTVSPGVQDPSGQPVFNPSWGNFGDDSFGECGVPVVHRYVGPATALGGGDRVAAAAAGNSMFWYSFSLGSVHVVTLSSEHDWTAGSPQYEWLAADLAGVDRSVTPWVVVTAHRPLYFSESSHADQHLVATHMRAELEPLFFKHSVDLVLHGHMHMYERTHPVVNGTVAGDMGDPRGTVYAVVGAGGIELDGAPYENPPPAWSAMRNETTYGYARVTAHNASHLHWQFVSTSGAASHVIDDVWLVSKHDFGAH